MVNFKQIRQIGFAAMLAVPLASHAGSGRLFVSSEKDASISVFDGTTHELITKIGTAARPRHIAFTPDRKQIYAACGDGNSIDIIDVETMKLVDRIDHIDDPEAFDFSPDGKTLYITLEDEGALGILDLDAFFAAREEKPELTVGEPDAADDDGDGDESGSDDDDDDDEEGDGEELELPGLTTVEVGQEPEGVLVSPDGSTVWVTSEVANTVHVVDAAGQELVDNIVVGNRPRRMALANDDTHLWVSNELAASVSIIDLSSGDVIENIEFLPPGFRSEEVTPVGVTITEDGKTAIVALGRSNHIAFVNVESREIEDYVLVGTRAWNAELTADNKTLYVTNGLSDDVTMIDMDSRRAKKSIPVGRVPYMVLIDD